MIVVPGDWRLTRDHQSSHEGQPSYAPTHWCRGGGRRSWLWHSSHKRTDDALSKFALTPELNRRMGEEST